MHRLTVLGGLKSEAKVLAGPCFLWGSQGRHVPCLFPSFWKPRVSFVVWRQLSSSVAVFSSSVFTSFFSLCVSASAHISPFYKSTGHIDWGPTFMISSELCHIRKDRISRSHHMLRCQQLNFCSHLKKFVCQNLIPNVIVFGGGGLGRWLGHEGGALKNGICALMEGFPRCLSHKESSCQGRKCKRWGFDPRIRKIPWKRKWQPVPVFLPEKLQGQRSLAGYSPWVSKEAYTAEHAHSYRREFRVFQSPEDPERIHLWTEQKALTRHHFCQHLDLALLSLWNSKK